MRNSRLREIALEVRGLILRASRCAELDAGFAVDDDAKPLKPAAKAPPARALKSSRSRPSEDHEDEEVSGAAGAGQEDPQRRLKAVC